MPNTIESPFFVFERERVYRCDLREITNATDVIGRIAGNASRKIRNAFSAAGSAWNLAHTADGTIVSAPLSALTLNTSFKVAPANGDESSWLYPSWKASPDAIRASPTWTPPATMKLWIVARLSFSDRRWRTQDRQYLVAQHATPTDATKGLWRLPISNLYEDSRLCVGNNTYTGATLADAVTALVDIVVSSTWQGDLMPNAAATSRLFRFDPATLAQRPSIGDWHRDSARVSNLILEGACYD